MNKDLKIKDIYIGKPDAKDELNSNKYDQFFQSFVIPSNLDINEILSGDKYYIRGYKGTGKTALLLYLSEKLRQEDKQACSSFILFKSDYGNVKKIRLNNISKNLIKTIELDKTILEKEQDFEYIWRWIFFKQIIEDNEEYNGGLFEENDIWEKFSELIGRISSDGAKQSVFRMPNKIKMAIDYSYSNTGVSTMSPGLELDFDSDTNNNVYTDFINILEIASELFIKLKRNNIPYYIFVDELEVFFADESILCRDLRMIRDLIITVKYFNGLILSANYKKTKIVASVRTEIINSIQRFIPSKEINKTMQGFELPISWNYSNTNSYKHPLIEIWLRRILISENTEVAKAGNTKEIYKKWFDEEIDGILTVNYILNNSWNKPRDIVRFLNAIKNTLSANGTKYTALAFNQCTAEYSLESMKEIREELNALYSPKDLDAIIICLTGFVKQFTVEELNSRIEKYFKNMTLKRETTQILQDLYRVGMIGNRSKATGVYRWQHKGDEGIIFGNDWKIIIHRALWKNLAISGNYSRLRNQVKENTKIDLKNKIVECIVTGNNKNFIYVLFRAEGKENKGCLHISQLLNNGYVNDIEKFAKPGDIFTAKVIEFDVEYSCWKLTKKGM